MSVILFFCCFLIILETRILTLRQSVLNLASKFFSVVVFYLSIETSKMPLGNQYWTPLKPYFSAVFYSS